jgi:hypothetical protein
MQTRDQSRKYPCTQLDPSYYPKLKKLPLPPVCSSSSPACPRPLPRISLPADIGFQEEEPEPVTDDSNSYTPKTDLETRHHRARRSLQVCRIRHRRPRRVPTPARAPLLPLEDRYHNRHTRARATGEKRPPPRNAWSDYFS